MTHRFISVDFETRSALDLAEVGVYTYAEDESTDVLCMAYALPETPDVVQLWKLGEPYPRDLAAAVAAGAYLRAWNAAFERIIWDRLAAPRYGWPRIPTERWVCTMALALAAGLPGKLELAAKALGLATQKDEAGHRLMLQMSRPRRVKGATARVWWDDADRLERLYAYCRQDVRVEDAIWEVLPPAMDKRERAIWLLDAAINDRGVRLDLPFVRAAVAMGRIEMDRLDAELCALSGGRVAGATKIADLKLWVGDQLGHTIDSLDKVALQTYLDSPLMPHVRRVLEIRQEAGKSSLAKYEKMDAMAGSGERARGMLQYYGAGTGRWAGRGIQMQNLPKGTLPHGHLPALIQWVRLGNAWPLTWLHDRPLDVLSGLLRSCIIPSEGRVFDVADYSAIEARVVAWLAGQQDLVDLFATGGKVYEVMAAAIFGGEAADYPKESNERDIGKRVVLGCGFGMGHEKFRATVIKQGGADPGEELSRLGVKTYRDFYPLVPSLWNNMDATALDVVSRGRTSWQDVPGTQQRLAFALHGDYLMLRLPTGRALWYCHPRVVNRLMPWSTDERPVRRPAIQCMALNDKKQWLPVDCYGGLFTENAVQAVARDIMADAMLRLDQAGWLVVLTVHDEIVTESEPQFPHAYFKRLMTTVPAWGAGCPIAVDAWRGDRYKK